MDQNNTPALPLMEPPKIPRQTQRYREEEWEVHRDRIANMYPIRGMTLKAIKSMLEEDHDFIVNERQLKKKIDDWKIAKNVQSSEMNFIVYKQQQRTLARKPTTFRARGQPVNPDKIVRWQKRNGKSVEKIVSPVPTTPSDISYSPASIRAPSPQIIEMTDLTSYSMMDWSSDGYQQPNSSHVHTIVDTSAHSSDRTSLNGMLVFEHTTFEGQSPAPFTPLPSPTPSPRILSAQVQTPPISHAESSLRNHSSDTLGDVPLESQHVTRPHADTAAHVFTNSNPLDHNLLAEPSRPRSRRKRYREDEELSLVQRLSEFQSRYGPSHPATLDTMTRLADVFQEQGRFRSAEVYFKKVAESYQINFGDDDLRTIGAFLDIVTILLKQSNLAPAERLCRKLQSKVLTLLPAEHVVNLRIMNELGRCQFDLGHLKEAEQIYRDSIRLGGGTLAPDDELLLLPMENLARLLVQRGELDEAERLLLAILDALGDQRGPKNIVIMDVRSSLGYMYVNQGRLQEAEITLRQVFADQMKVLGPENRSTLFTQRNLAFALESQERYKESEELLRDVTQKSEKTLGRKHLVSLRYHIDLANVANRRSKFQEAERIGKEFLLLSEETLGTDHDLTCTISNMLGISYDGQGRLEEALEIFQVAAERSARTLGDEHRNTMVFKGNVLRVERKIEERLMAGLEMGFF